MLRDFFFSKMFLVVWTICAVIGLIIRGYRARRYLQRRPRFPARSEIRILFEENWASGHSLENIFTRLGGASNCLHVTVTTDELWTTVPLAFLTDELDLEHRIKKSDIVAIIEPNGLFQFNTLIVEYRREDGRLARMEITSRHYKEFKKALKVGLHVA